MFINKIHNWYTLDNSAKLYPMLVTSSSQNLFRLTAELTEDIDHETLSKALIDILPRFPSFKVKLKRGLFWCYFEENNNKPLIFKDDGILLRQLDDEDNNGFLFRIMYFQKKIIIELFHVLCDGKGALEFGKALVFQYLILKGCNVTSDEKVITVNSPSNIQEVEDSFLINYQDKKLKEIDIKSIRGETSYKIKGTLTNKDGLGVIEAILPLDQIKKLSKEHDCTVTIFLTALALYSIFNTNIGKKSLKLPLLAFVPIDLRKYYSSRTLRNFVMFSRIGIRKGDSTETFEDFINAAKRDLAKDMTKESIENKINGSVKLQKMILTRMIPLPLKYFIFRYVKQIFGSNKHTLPISNVGPTVIPDSMKPYVSNFYFTVNTKSNMPVSIGINSYENKLNVIISRSILETDIEKFFFRYLTSLGVDVQISSNMWEMN